MILIKEKKKQICKSRAKRIAHTYVLLNTFIHISYLDLNIKFKNLVIYCVHKFELNLKTTQRRNEITSKRTERTDSNFAVMFYSLKSLRMKTKRNLIVREGNGDDSQPSIHICKPASRLVVYVGEIK